MVFRGDNYEEWARSIRLSLRARRKFGFVEGTIPRPTEPSKLEDWFCVQSTLVQWLLHTIDPSLKKTLPYFEEVKPLWDALKARFDIGNGPSRQQLKRQLAECRQSKGMSIADYFGRLQPLWDELSTYNPPPACKCGNCVCDIGKQFQSRVDEDRLHDFLYGIDDEIFCHICSILLALDPPPSLNRAYQTMLQEERLRSASRTYAIVTPSCLLL